MRLSGNDVGPPLCIWTELDKADSLSSIVIVRSVSVRMKEKVPDAASRALPDGVARCDAIRRRFSAVANPAGETPETIQQGEPEPRPGVYGIGDGREWGKRPHIGIS